MAVRKLLVASQRSGVGKTTTSINLAAAAAMAGARVLLLEADPMSEVSRSLNLAQHPDRQPLRGSGVEIPGVLCSGVIPGLDVISPYEEGVCSEDHLEQVFQLISAPPFRDNYDCLIVNSQPFLGSRPEPVLAACDEYLVVMQAESMAHRMLPAFNELVQRSTKQAGVTIQWRGILLTLPENEVPGGAVERELRGRFGTRVFPMVVPFDEEVNKAQMFGHVLVHATPDSPAAVEYKELVSHLRLAGSVAAGRTVRSVNDMLVMAAPSVRPVAQRAEPATKRKSRATIPTVRPSIPASPPPPRQEAPSVAPPKPIEPTADTPRPIRGPRAMRGSSTRYPVVHTPPAKTAPTAPAPVAPQAPAATARPAAPAPTAQAAPAASGINLKYVLPFVALALGVGVGCRFLPLGSILESEMAMPIAVGIATTAAVGLGLWVMAQQPNKPETPAEKPKK